MKSGYNVIRLPDKNSQYLADFMVQEGVDRRRGSLLGMPTYYQSPESLILAKLRMIKATIPRERSFKDRADIEGILDNTMVNKRLIRQRARKEGTLEIFDAIVAEMSPSVRRKAEKSSS